MRLIVFPDLAAMMGPEIFRLGNVLDAFNLAPLAGEGLSANNSGNCIYGTECRSSSSSSLILARLMSRHGTT